MTGYYIPCGRQGKGADGDFLWVNESKMEKEIAAAVGIPVFLRARTVATADKNLQIM